jgi:hypothetical protein
MLYSLYSIAKGHASILISIFQLHLGIDEPAFHHSPKEQKVPAKAIQNSFALEGCFKD